MNTGCSSLGVVLVDNGSIDRSVIQIEIPPSVQG